MRESSRPDHTLTHIFGAPTDLLQPCILAGGAQRQVPSGGWGFKGKHLVHENHGPQDVFSLSHILNEGKTKFGLRVQRYSVLSHAKVRIYF